MFPFGTIAARERPLGPAGTRSRCVISPGQALYSQVARVPRRLLEAIRRVALTWAYVVRSAKWEHGWDHTADRPV